MTGPGRAVQSGAGKGHEGSCQRGMAVPRSSFGARDAPPSRPAGIRPPPPGRLRAVRPPTAGGVTSSLFIKYGGEGSHGFSSRLTHFRRGTIPQVAHPRRPPTTSGCGPANVHPDAAVARPSERAGAEGGLSGGRAFPPRGQGFRFRGARAFWRLPGPGPPLVLVVFVRCWTVR
eukprot:CAMPEP_0174373350 /NCGR_PEP_ID=MMETSP0811_2-20130205/106756_1 /TAXON_ID=73025 ORGANISM="Eutreptiella gymnastica-like, Strain CCMP1594" /NCGR_SAMPLE_ID=MMETSP0811_2 /ASSEMBLY_ACC=CAM_ASM_000667 /LENGTH=173 /DNA_ID=CAMNT_0015521579 /DNA_START=55 /DNA_END=571 /DNA_ORIENTATION=-